MLKHSAHPFLTRILLLLRSIKQIFLKKIDDDKHMLLSGIVCQDEAEEIADEHDLDNDADDLDDDDDDVTEDVPEHFADDLEIERKEKEIDQVTL